ncbi:DUF397 domain-containing protein [Actinomadura sp. BRA 177]|uniref:DUF397 domain-containing protein n=1 Tax=Actinomadura sp. BRA 177 TaxID=2745202 RepID=UPI001595D6B6|nr:DUF397 domain-containing protein [Actinomadura sp. BRA 177]NVI88566.1 DUF397 domain-containing protein [Actinomadura sp. BRA 177]
MDLNSELTWCKSSRSANNAACVEVASWKVSSHSGNGGVDCVEVGACDCCGTAVRDSKDPGGPKLAFSAASWRAFHADVLTGRYDLT